MIRLLVLLLTVLTGFSGLVYEVTWQRYLATLLGSHSEATAAVLGLFLGGLAAGYSIFGAITRRLVARADAQARSAPLLIVYGVVEAGIGVFALIFPVLFTGVQALSFQIPHGSAGLGFALDVFLSALLILPPAILMGGTIPILTQALARSLDDATRFHALVYAFNTAGAFAGALAAGFWLVPSLGLVGVLRWMGAINLIAGAVFLGLGVLRPAPARSGPPRAEAPQRVAGFARFAAVALLTGFAMMTLQTVLIRLGGLSFGSSQFTFSMVVAVFVLCIALGSFAVSALSRIPPLLLPVCLWSLLALLVVLYFGAEQLPFQAYALRSAFENRDADFHPFYFSAFGGLLAAIGIPVALSGAVLPLIFHALRDEVGDLGDVAGRLYSWNTLGSLLGALIGGYALLFWFDLHHTYRFAMAAIALAALLAGGFALRLAPRLLAAALVLCSGVAIAALPAWRPERLNAGLVPQQGVRIPNLPSPSLGADAFFAAHPLTGKDLKDGSYRWIFHDDDPTSSVTVTEKLDARGRRVRALRSSGRPEGGSVGSDKTMRLAALLPALLAERMERAFVVGYGLGMTVGELASLASMREVVVAEISPGVIEAAPLFDDESLGASQHPAVVIVNSDAYRALIRSRGSFDAIVSTPSHTWVAGVEMLFSREFLEAVRERLTPGGVYLQWFVTNGVPGDEAEPTAMALRTFASVFPTVAVWYGTGSELLILGLNSERDALDLDRIHRLSLRTDVAAGLARADLPSLASLLAHELLPLGVVHAAPLEGPIHTLLQPRLGNLAARAVFSNAEAVLPPTADLETARVGQRNSLQGRFAARFGGRLPELERANLVGQICLHRPRECQTQLAAWIRDVPESPTREMVIARLREGSRGRINPSFVPELLPLFGVGPASEGPVTPAEAERLTDLFVAWYAHAAPFPRSVLADLWRRCEEAPAQQEACRAGRAAAELRLGALDAG